MNKVLLVAALASAPAAAMDQNVLPGSACTASSNAGDCSKAMSTTFAWASGKQSTCEFEWTATLSTPYMITNVTAAFVEFVPFRVMVYGSTDNAAWTPIGRPQSNMTGMAWGFSLNVRAFGPFKFIRYHMCADNGGFDGGFGHGKAIVVMNNVLALGHPKLSASLPKAP
ncbi:MAG: hypothetical protein WBW81_10005 [Methylocella sp.]